MASSRVRSGATWAVGAYHALMGLRFYRRVRLFPGVSVNLSRSGPSLTMGVRGAHVTVGSRGVTKTFGVPGTGLFYTSRQSLHTGYHSEASDRLLTPEEHAAAARHAERVTHLGPASTYWYVTGTPALLQTAADLVDALGPEGGTR